MDIYREEILEHWQNPQNFGKLNKADLVIEQINPLCGDILTFFFKFSSPSSFPRKWESETGFSIKSRMTRNSSRFARTIIADVSFTGNGCAISIAAASMLSDKIKNKPVSYLKRITGEDVLELIGGSVSPARLKCAFLSLEAVKKVSGN